MGHNVGSAGMVSPQTHEVANKLLKEARGTMDGTRGAEI